MAVEEPEPVRQDTADVEAPEPEPKVEHIPRTQEDSPVSLKASQMLGPQLGSQPPAEESMPMLSQPAKFEIRPVETEPEEEEPDIPSEGQV